MLVEVDGDSHQLFIETHPVKMYGEKSMAEQLFAGSNLLIFLT